MSDSSFSEFYLDETPEQATPYITTTVRIPLPTVASLDALALFFVTSRTYIINQILAKEVEEICDRLSYSLVPKSLKNFQDCQQSALQKLTGESE